MNRSQAYLTLYAETAIHVGIGQETGPIDLPIARERHTGIPIIPGHGLKGALRAFAECQVAQVQDGAAARRKIAEVFGPEGSDDAEQGRVIVAEALPVVVPFRTLQDVFVWATCPLLLERLSARAGISVTWQDPAEGEFVLPEATGNEVDPEIFVIEDLEFQRRSGSHNLSIDTWLGPGRRPSRRQPLVLSDTDFCFLVRHCMPVTARVRLTGGKTTDEWKNPETGKTEKGSLWSEELLPSDTILLATVDGVERPGGGGQFDAHKLMSAVLPKIADPKQPMALQLGGGETVGRGWCWARLFASPAPR